MESCATLRAFAESHLPQETCGLGGATERRRKGGLVESAQLLPDVLERGDVAARPPVAHLPGLDLLRRGHRLGLAADDIGGGAWDGSVFMCTRDETFTIFGVEDCLARGYERTGFFEIDTQNRSDWTLQLTDDGDGPGSQGTDVPEGDDPTFLVDPDVPGAPPLPPEEAPMDGAPARGRAVSQRGGRTEIRRRTRAGRPRLSGRLPSRLRRTTPVQCP